MLYEGNVIEAVCNHLKDIGFSISSKCTVKQRGDDIVALGTGQIRELRIEAKGETSSHAASARYGKPFNDGQVKNPCC